MRFVLGIFFVLLMSVNILADDRGFDVVLKEMKSEPRVALVIGNKDYTSLNSLKNPINDARDMVDILRKKGFYIIGNKALENASQYQMEQAITQFANKIRRGKGVGLFYYAGHGVEVNGVNYLIPSDAQIPSIDFIRSKTVSVDSVISAMENAQNRFNILILDACRSNPFGRGGGGLAPINSATGIYVAYATAPGKIAEDGIGRNGLFTNYLKEYINQSGLKIEEVFKNVRREVKKASHKRQVPWTSSSVDGDFYFSLPKKPILPIVKQTSTVIHKSQPVISTTSIKHSITKWINPTSHICKINRGEMDNKGICKANWRNAKKICYQSKSRLPSIKDFNDLISSCGGTNSPNYKSCYHEYGFSDNFEYWSIDTQQDMTFNARTIFFPEGKTYVQSKNIDFTVAVRCIKRTR